MSNERWCPGDHPVQLGAHRPDERHELVLVARDERLEVQVDPVGAPVADRVDGLPARLRRALALPRSAFWTAAWPDVQAKTVSVSVTRLRFAWAALMIEVISELVQPAQPVVSEPSASRFFRLPFASAPTEK